MSNQKLSAIQVREMREKYATGTYSQFTLSGMYGIHPVSAHLILTRRQRREVAPGPLEMTRLEAPEPQDDKSPVARAEELENKAKGLRARAAKLEAEAKQIRERPTKPVENAYTERLRADIQAAEKSRRFDEAHAEYERDFAVTQLAFYRKTYGKEPPTDSPLARLAEKYGVK